MIECKYSLLRQVFSWGFLEAFLFQIILIIHNVCLFNKIAASQYGTVGVIFSIAYGLAYGATAGFDVFYAQEKRKSSSLCIQFIWIGVFFFVATIIGHLTAAIAPLTLFLGLVEAIKRSLKIITTYHRKFAQVASYELLNIVLYSGTVWSIAIQGHQLTVPVLILPLVITTSLCSIAYTYNVPVSWQWSFDKTIFYNRIMLCIGSLYQIIFSDNVMVPLAYKTLGPVYAGGIKLASNCTHGIITIMERLLNTGAVILNDQKNHTTMYQVMGTYVWRSTAIGSIIASLLIGYTFLKQNTLFLLPYAALYMILRIASIMSVLCKRMFIAISPHKTPYITILSLLAAIVSFYIGIHTEYPLLGITIFVLARIVLSMGLGIASSRHVDRHYFNILSYNLIILSCALFLCVFFIGKQISTL